MLKFGKAVVKGRIPIIILAVLLLIPSIFGALNTRINYDMLNYLPADMDTTVGQGILLDDFGKGAFSFVIVEGMDSMDTATLKTNIEAVPHVESVIWYDSLFDVSVPMDMLPEKYFDAFNSDNCTMMAVFFDASTSADETMNAISNIRSVAGKQCYISGMSAMVTDLKQLCEQEEPIYVGLAVLLACVVMMIFMDSWLVPVIFLISIAMTIIYNLGSNYFIGEISYITKALSAVLQLGVTMDYSIFLWHSYSEQKLIHPESREDAMAHAIQATITSVVGSSITTIAGFLALCFMSFTLGRDLGIVMAKGVLFGVIGCVTILPSMILLLDKLIAKTMHRTILPRMNKFSKFVAKHAWIFLVIFVLLAVPAYYGYAKTNDGVYYDLGQTLPQDMEYAIANSKLKDEFDVATTHMLLVDAKLPSRDVRRMMDEIEKVDGIKYTLGLESVVGPMVPEEMLPDSIRDVLESDEWKLILINSAYGVASDLVNNQIDQINSILTGYNGKSMLIGEAPCTKDMIEVTNHDFQVVTIISILAIFVIIALVLKSVSLPIILVAVIEFAIFINLGLPYYAGTSLPFVAPICISTIQLGATVDYAILMTTRYKKERSSGQDKLTSVSTALAASIPSIVVSALGFFAATFGVGLYSDIDIISSMCSLMARGAIVSMISVIFILPSMFMLFDKVICNTGFGFKPRKTQNINSAKTEEVHS